MKWSCLLAVLGLSITNVGSLAQRPPVDQVPELTESSSQDAGFFATSGVVKFQLIQGRLALDAPRHRKGSQNCDDGGVCESITVTAERGIPSLHYIRRSPQHHLTLSVQRARLVRIESWFPKTSERSVLQQPAVGNLQWSVRRGDIEDEHVGATLLHLRHADRPSFDLHYGGLITRLLRGRSLQTLCEEAQVLMLRKLNQGTLPTAANIHACVDDMRSNRLAVRMKAERQLLAWGTPVIATLQGLNPRDLDAEQLWRVGCILKRLQPCIDDTPATLAKLLVNDANYWKAISGSLQDQQLRFANQHLQRFGAPMLVASDVTERIATAEATRHD